VENVQVRNEQIFQLTLGFGDRAFDYLVIFGDLNYRTEKDYETSVGLIQAGEIGLLLQADQLLNAMAELGIFSGFSEAPITFDPTFCFDPASNIYDSSPKHRPPAWTDRVIIRTSPAGRTFGPSDQIVIETDGLRDMCRGKDIPPVPGDIPANYPTCPRVVRYVSHQIRTSDHRPVEATYLFDIPVILSERKREFNEEVT